MISSFGRFQLSSLVVMVFCSLVVDGAEVEVIESMSDTDFYDFVYGDCGIEAPGLSENTSELAEGQDGVAAKMMRSVLTEQLVRKLKAANSYDRSAVCNMMGPIGRPLGRLLIIYLIK